MSKTYLELVNDTILESGADLHQFAPDGSDFEFSGHDSLMYKFKTWVARAWQTVQQNAYDWQFMSDQAVVNLDPGIMFYGDRVREVVRASPDMVSLVGADGTMLREELPVRYMTDLTGKVTDTEGLGVATFKEGAVLDFGLRAGSDKLAFSTVESADAFVSRMGAIASPGTRVVIRSSVQGQRSLDRTYNAEVVRYDIDTKGHYINFSTELEASVFKAMNDAWPGLVRTYLVVDTGPYSDFKDDQLRSIPIDVYPEGWYPDESVIPSTDMLATAVSIGIQPSTYEAQYIRFQYNTVTGTEELTLDSSMYTLVTQEIFSADTGVAFASVIKLSEYAADVLRGTLFGDEGNVLDKVFFNVLGGPEEYILDRVGLRFKGYSGEVTVHGWKSYDWSEELQDNDFVESVAEIDHRSFKMLVEHGPGNVSEAPLPFVPWETFRAKYNDSTQKPGIPSAITKDSVGRWRLWPVPSKPITVTFDYVRNPQQLKEPEDTPKNLPRDLADIIMWRALMYYGEYDEQPSVTARATRNYKDLLSRMELRYRGKFHFAPRQLW